MVQLKLILDTRKQKADGTYSIYFRITERKKVFYVHSGFSVQQQYWNDSDRRVTKAYENAQIINASISKKHFEIQKAIIELEEEGLFSLDSLKEKLVPKIQSLTFKEYSDIVIKEMFGKNRTGNALTYQTGVNSVLLYKPSKQLRFTDISTRFIEGYIEHLQNRGCKINTIGNYLRTLRAIYNKAIKAKIIDRKYYPFNEISIKREKTAKRAFSNEIIRAIKDMEFVNDNGASLARDYYMLSFYLIGINFADLAYLTNDNIIEDRVEYKRRKTGILYNIKLLPQAKQLIEKHSIKGRKYLLPILPDTIVENGLQAKKLTQQWIKTTNKECLKRITTEIGISKPCTTYSARHTFATIAKRLGYSKELISEALGHQDGNQITEIYLDKFDREVIDKMHETVISLVKESPVLSP